MAHHPALTPRTSQQLRGNVSRGAHAVFALLIVALAMLVLLSDEAAYAQESRFGDSTWVAPYPPAAADSTPEGTGARVAAPDRARPVETAIRFPFRVLFYPVRLVARGAEQLVGFAGPRYDPSRHYTVHPAFAFSSAAGAAIGVTVSPPKIAFSRHDYAFRLKTTWSRYDSRRLRLEQWIGQRDKPVNLSIDYMYNYRPNYRFYGLGNDSKKESRATYLEEESQIELMLRYGVKTYRRFAVIGGYSHISSRRGYNGDSRKVEDAFGEVPFAHRGSEIYYYGVGLDYSFVDDDINPSFGTHVRGHVRQNHGAHGLDLQYLSWRAEVRGYIPVFAKRRVIALRVVEVGVRHDKGEPVPFYRLPVPSSSLETRFSAYSSRRFRDNHLLLAHGEYRWVIWENLWAVALAQVGQVAPEASQLRVSDLHESYGGGLRYGLSEDATARAEVATGAEGTVFYVDVSTDF